jgi:hypothetical protein
MQPCWLQVCHIPKVITIGLHSRIVLRGESTLAGTGIFLSADEIKGVTETL